jgi:hypothetical protein
MAMVGPRRFIVTGVTMVDPRSVIGSTSFPNSLTTYWTSSCVVVFSPKIHIDAVVIEKAAIGVLGRKLVKGLRTGCRDPLNLHSMSSMQAVIGTADYSSQLLL